MLHMESNCKKTQHLGEEGVRLECFFSGRGRIRAAALLEASEHAELVNTDCSNRFNCVVFVLNPLRGLSFSLDFGSSLYIN